MNCVFCGRDVTEYPSVLVDFEGGVEEVCTDCMADTDDTLPDRLEAEKAWAAA